MVIPRAGWGRPRRKGTARVVRCQGAFSTRETPDGPRPARCSRSGSGASRARRAACPRRRGRAKRRGGRGGRSTQAVRCRHWGPTSPPPRAQGFHGTGELYLLRTARDHRHSIGDLRPSPADTACAPHAERDAGPGCLEGGIRVPPPRAARGGADVWSGLAPCCSGSGAQMVNCAVGRTLNPPPAPAPDATAGRSRPWGWPRWGRGVRGGRLRRPTVGRRPAGPWPPPAPHRPRTG